MHSCRTILWPRTCKLANPATGSPDAQDLRRVLLDCIECLRPQPAAHGDAARAYAVLTYRCVDGLTIDAIEEKLGLSRRQTYREYTKGVEAVARQLWDRLQAGESSVQRADAGGQAVRYDAMSRRALAATELERLGKEARREPISLPEVLEGVCQLLETRFQQRGISLTSTVLGTVSPVVADRTLLRQALLNLLSHAVDTAPSQRELVITAEECDGAVQISVALVPADNGVTGTQTPLPREGWHWPWPRRWLQHKKVSSPSTRLMIPGMPPSSCLRPSRPLCSSSTTMRA